MKTELSLLCDGFIYANAVNCEYVLMFVIFFQLLLFTPYSIQHKRKIVIHRAHSVQLIHVRLLFVIS